MYQYREVAPGDLDLICRHRREMFTDSGRPAQVLAAMAQPFRDWLAPRLASGVYFGWIAQAQGRPIGGLGMQVIDWAPHPNHPAQDRRGYILNVFVEPEHRGRGVATALMAMAADEGRRRGLDYLALHATEKGRPLYAKLGWSQGKEMGLNLK
ncbi:GNAT family N-acetyltransferase [Phenylobacterium sp.]|uniref:GNAT family N-acetyltransferase n=1 Tax=Phenylobacterium sp. TaxID=1871053 RepID=UPI002DE77807|nr:GNAT family N-acetyltransferase [Phenylobacterium sp.]